MVIKRQFVSDVEEVLIEAFKKESIVQELSKSLAQSICDKLNNQFAEITDKINRISKEFQEFKTVSADKEKGYLQKINSIEQYSRRNNLRIFGLKETKNEDTENVTLDFLNRKLKMGFTTSNIGVCYRVGRQTSNKPRAVLINFVNHKQRMEVYYKKKDLKGSGITMKEDLTTENLNKYAEASDKYGFKNTWTKNGIVYVKTAERVVKYTDNLDDEPSESQDNGN